jgi:hypothetical protein
LPGEMELCLRRWTAAWKAATAVSPFPLSFSCNIAAEVVWAEKAVAGRATTFARALSAVRSSGRRCREEEWTRRQLSRVVSRLLPLLFCQVCLRLRHQLHGRLASAAGRLVRLCVHPSPPRDPPSPHLSGWVDGPPCRRRVTTPHAATRSTSRCPTLAGTCSQVSPRRTRPPSLSLCAHRRTHPPSLSRRVTAAASPPQPPLA